jgi:putative DNA primase/helicase
MANDDDIERRSEDVLRRAGRNDVIAWRRQQAADDAETEAIFAADLETRSTDDGADHRVRNDADDTDDVDDDFEAIAADMALPDGYRATDGGNADRLIALHGNHLRHVAVWRKWCCWDGCRWRIDYGDRLTLGRARDVVPHLIRLAARVGDKKQRKALLGFAERTESSRGLRALTDVAASAASVRLDHETLDADPWLLNLTNGTLDLRTGELCEHRPDDLLTMLAGTTFAANASAPCFETFIAQVLPDVDVRTYVQCRLGGALVGEIRDHELNIAYGEGANGKTTLFNIVGSVLGDYAVVAPKTLLIASRHEHHPTDRTTLFRRRLAYAGEIAEGAYLNEALVKELTGGDRITGRRMREDFWSFNPTHKLWLFANHLPHVSGSDRAIWRRVRVIPFQVTIPERDQDPHLADKIVSDEGPGVLAWLLDGVRAWQSGMSPPRAGLLATETYRHGEDTAERFVTDELAIDPDGTGSLYASELWETHRQWCAENGVADYAVKREVQRVAERLRTRGCDRVRLQHDGRRDTLWLGVRLVAHVDDRDDDAAKGHQRVPH